MTEIIQAIVEKMKEQRIEKLGAIVDRSNRASIRVLEKAGFKKVYEFDPKQDYYKI